MTTYLDMNGLDKPSEKCTIPAVPSLSAMEETQYCTLGQKGLEKDNNAYSDAKSEIDFLKDDAPILPMRKMKRNEFPDYRQPQGQLDGATYISPSESPYMSGPRRRPWKLIVLCLVVGFVLGGIVFSLLWLTVDKLKDPTVIYVQNADGVDSPIISPQAQTSGGQENANQTDSQATDTATDSNTVVQKGGFVYYRWGRTTCSENSSLLYKGYTAGGRFLDPGATTNTLCLPDNPSYGNYNNVTETARNILYGAEFEGDNSAWFGKNVHDQNLPCAVCQATGRSAHMMIPGSTTCVSDWTEEYTGYLMGNRNTNDGSYETICVDSNPVSVMGFASDNAGKLLYLTEIDTDSIPSPPYTPGRELACVVCTQ